jgi:carboxypeptidase Taq
MSAQLLDAARRDTPGLDNALSHGNYQPLLTWLTEHVYRHGRAYDANELLQRSTGATLNVGPYLNYLSAKFGDLYGLSQ